jgi:hypothetical protein
VKVPETKIIVGPEAIRRELIAEYWRVRVPTTEIALAMGIDEAEVCRVIEELEGDSRNEQSDLS